MVIIIIMIISSSSSTTIVFLFRSFGIGSEERRIIFRYIYYYLPGSDFVSHFAYHQRWAYLQTHFNLIGVPKLFATLDGGFKSLYGGVYSVPFIPGMPKYYPTTGETQTEAEAEVAATEHNRT